MSHEFKTPLNVINSAVQVIQVICGQELSETAMRMINKIKQNTFRQLRLVNNILDMAKLSAGKLKSNKRNLDIVLMTQAIVESIEVYAKQRQVEINFNSTIGHHIIGIDDSKYERILLNLLSNAIKFTPKGKSVSVSLKKKVKEVIIEVKDEGIGIPEDKHKYIFEQFGQVKSVLNRPEEGTGIGLSLVKLLVEEMGGSIALTSQEGTGSTFAIRLPSEKVEAYYNSSQQIQSYEERLVQTVHIEFSDIYL
jgi:signal transduction histidine kinase